MSVPRGFRGWVLEYRDGRIIKEGEMEWKKTPKLDVVRLTLHFDGRQWDIVNQVAYFQKKRGSMIPGCGESFQIESRTIGYYSDKQKISYTVDENTGRMTMDVKDIL